MPVMIPDGLPAAAVLERENVELIGTGVALRQDVRPLRILLFNLMPAKVETELQIARLLSHTPLQIELVLLSTATHTPRNTAARHMEMFYRYPGDIRDEYYDGMIVTGAPVERLPFDRVDYWNEFCEVLDWAGEHVFRRCHICWGAQAALYREFGIRKRTLARKLSGIYRQTVLDPADFMMRGFPARYACPVSRFTTLRAGDADACDALSVLAGSRQTGPSIIVSRKSRDLYILDHLEYDTGTLALEYGREQEAGLEPAIPVGYFPAGDPLRPPENSWRPYGYLLFGTWIQLLYRDTPFVARDIPGARQRFIERNG